MKFRAQLRAWRRLLQLPRENVEQLRELEKLRRFIDELDAQKLALLKENQRLRLLVGIGGGWGNRP